MSEIKSKSKSKSKSKTTASTDIDGFTSDEDFKNITQEIAAQRLDKIHRLDNTRLFSHQGSCEWMKNIVVKDFVDTKWYRAHVFDTCTYMQVFIGYKHTGEWWLAQLNGSECYKFSKFMNNVDLATKDESILAEEISSTFLTIDPTLLAFLIWMIKYGSTIPIDEWPLAINVETVRLRTF